MTNKTKKLIFDPIDHKYPIEYTDIYCTRKEVPADNYVWVTPNTINPEIHDMQIYDMRINGTPDENHYNYDLNLPYQSYVNEYATATNYPYLNYKTGEYRRNNTQHPLAGGSLDFTTSIIDITYEDNDSKTIMLSSDMQCSIREDDGRTYVNGSNFIEETVTFPCDWSNATNLPTEQEWDLSWLEIKTKLK